jgi:hypothetical protein
MTLQSDISIYRYLSTPDLESDALDSLFYSFPVYFLPLVLPTWPRGSVVRLRHYATCRNVAGSISDQVIEFVFSLPNTSSCTMALEFIYPLTKMNIRNLSGG